MARESAPNGNRTKNGRLPACPRCERPIVSVTVLGPTDSVAKPCGCRIVPGMVPDPSLE